MRCSSSTGFVAAALIAIVLPGLSVAGSEAGYEALEREDYDTARREFTIGAEKGDSASQYNLGVLHQRGLGGPRSRKLAAELFREAAMQHQPDAAFALGLMYANGEGVRRDLVQAYMWFRVEEKQKHKGAREAMRKVHRSLTLDQVIEARKAADLLFVEAAEEGSGDNPESRTNGPSESNADTNDTNDTNNTNKTGD